MSETRTGAGGPSPRWSTCRPRPCSGRGTSPVSGSAGRWTVPSRCLCSKRWRPRPLLPLPSEPFVPARWSKATVGPDIHIKVGRTLYSVLWKLIGRRVGVRSTAATVQIFHEGELVKTHAALEQGKRTDKNDHPPERIAFQMRTPIWCRGQASQVGDACRQVIDQLLEVNALYRLRAAQGVLGLRKKYGDIRLEAACRKTAPLPSSRGGGLSWTSLPGRPTPSVWPSNWLPAWPRPGAGMSTTAPPRRRSWSSPTRSSAIHASRSKAVGRRRTTRAPSESPSHNWTGRTDLSGPAS
ncbi:Mu transposase domain-containing protein [Streptomyces sp. NRRL B-2790]|uniref:Mu transposase domain-containing protein n=1 Tax=Streptomyces sp. NRRL B-2790 TaxID=1463835 RepID=UPI00356473AD